MGLGFKAGVKSFSLTVSIKLKIAQKLYRVWPLGPKSLKVRVTLGFQWTQ